MYHEKQSLSQCGLHMVNNILQRKEYTKADFDSLADTLHCNYSNTSWFLYNQHRSILGHYDLNVIELALSKHELKTVWLRNTEDLYDEIYNKHAEKQPKALMINDTRYKIFKHWLAILIKDDKLTNLDSKIKTPKLLGPATPSTFQHEIFSNANHIILVYK